MIKLVEVEVNQQQLFLDSLKDSVANQIISKISNLDELTDNRRLSAYEALSPEHISDLNEDFESLFNQVIKVLGKESQSYQLCLDVLKYLANK